MRRLGIVFFGLLGLANTNSAKSQDLDKQSQALELISRTAASICNTVTSNGSAVGTSASGKIETQLNSLLRNLTGIGISGTASYDSKHWSGIVQEDLAQAYSDNANCKTNVFNKLLPMVPNIGASVSTKDSPSCPSIAGKWIDDEGNVIQIRQAGCVISTSISLMFGVIKFELNGNGYADGFKFQMTSDLCHDAVIPGAFTGIQNKKMVMRWEMADKPCGPEQGKGGSTILVRVN